MAELRGKRVVLRPLRPDDFDAWADVRRRSRDWLEPWEPLPEVGSPDPVTDRDAFTARCGSWDRQRHLDAAYGYGVFLDGGFIGEVSLGTVHRGPFQTAFVGYWIDEPLAGRGLTPEAVALLVDHAFGHLKLHRVEAAVVPRNSASIRVVEKLGMRYEGVAKRFLQIRGVWEDHARYALTVEEWAEHRTELSDLYLRGPALRSVSRTG